MKTVVYSALAVDQLDELPVKAREQIIEALVRYATTGMGDVKKLSGLDVYRLRSGRYRVVFEEDEANVIVIRVVKRDTTTYKR